MMPNQFKLAPKQPFECWDVKKEVRFSFHFFFQLNFFFSFATSKVGQLLNWKTKYKPTWKNKEHDPLAKAKFKLVIKSNVFEKVHDHHPTCFSKSNKCHHANYGCITTYQPSKWLANIDVFPYALMFFVYFTPSQGRKTHNQNSIPFTINKTKFSKISSLPSGNSQPREV